MTHRIPITKTVSFPEIFNGFNPANTICERPDYKNIFLDLDGVVINIITELAVVAQKLFQVVIKEEDIVNYDMSPALTRSQIKTIFTQRGFWKRCPPYDGSIDFANRLYQRTLEMGKYRLVILSNCSYNITQFKEGNDKLRWVKTYLENDYFQKSMCLTTDKVKLFHQGDIVIDDSPHNLIAAQSAGAIPVCVKRPWNMPTSKPGWKGNRFSFDKAFEFIKLFTE